MEVAALKHKSDTLRVELDKADGAGQELMQENEIVRAQVELKLTKEARTRRNRTAPTLDTDFSEPGDNWRRVVQAARNCSWHNTKTARGL